MFQQLYDQAAYEVRVALGPPDAGRGSSQAHQHAAELVAAMRYGRIIAPALDDSLLAALLSQPVYELPKVYARYYAEPRNADRDAALWILKRVIDEQDGIAVAFARMVLTGQRL